MNGQNSNPLVSVAMPVYNHGAHIAKALDSILMQKADFDIEIVISDDYSTDNTREILKTYYEKHPDKIKLLLTENNRGVNQCSLDIFQNCNGKYLAFLEGDDYWINENKLQKQIDFLEQNPEYIGCFHDAEIISNPEADISKHNQYHQEFKYYSQFNRYRPDFFPRDVIERNIIPTASLVVRNSNNIPDFFKAFNDICLSLNWAFQIFMVKNSKFYYINEPLSAYNDHPGGISKTTSLNSFKLSNIKVLKRFVNETHLRYVRNSIYRTITEEYRQILISSEPTRNKKTNFYKTLFLFSFYYLKTLRFEIENFFENKKHLKNR